MDRVETRELAYFVAVAEELHFGRAAERLGIAQPPLSRAIQQLERRLGVTLLERNSRRVALTPAGEVLLHDGRIALDAMSAATRRAQRTGRVEPRLAVAMKPGGDGGLLPDILEAYRSEPDAVGVEVLLCGMHEREVMVRDGRADVGFLHSTHGDLSGFETQALLEEGQVAVLSARHRFAGRRSLLMADLEGEPMPRWPGAPGGAKKSPRIRDAGQLMQLIALGEAITVVPESVFGQLRRDLVCVPVIDAPTTTVLLAWPEQSVSRPLAAFVRAAAKVAAASTAAVRGL